jgi:hypothetical protein
MARQIFIKFSNIKFHKHLLAVFLLFHKTASVV